jgi:hypothetical protein
MDDLLRSGSGYFNGPRDVVIYFKRRLKGEILKVVSKLFGIGKNSTVSSGIDRVKGHKTAC